MIHTFKTSAVCAAAITLSLTSLASAATTYSTSFEAPEFTTSGAQDATGVLAEQGGWNCRASAGFANDDYDFNHGYVTFGDEKVNSTTAHSGPQCWRYSRSNDRTSFNLIIQSAASTSTISPSKQQTPSPNPLHSPSSHSAHSSSCVVAAPNHSLHNTLKIQLFI